MIWILLSVLYVALGYLYAEAAWRSPEIKEELENIRAVIPPEMIEKKLALAKLILVIGWPICFIGTIVVYIRQVLGIISSMKKDEDE